MRFILDTNICIYIIKKKPEQVFDRFKSVAVGDLCISAITFSELQYGVSKSASPDRNQAALTEFLGPINILDYPAAAAVRYGDIKAQLATRGQIIGPNYLLIAAHALTLGAVLITNNETEFRRVPGLTVENWVVKSLE